jgi:hypothetical protein
MSAGMNRLQTRIDVTADELKNGLRVLARDCEANIARIERGAYDEVDTYIDYGRRLQHLMHKLETLVDTQQMLIEETDNG